MYHAQQKSPTFQCCKLRHFDGRSVAAPISLTLWYFRFKYLFYPVGSYQLSSKHDTPSDCSIEICIGNCYLETANLHRLSDMLQDVYDLCCTLYHQAAMHHTSVARRGVESIFCSNGYCKSIPYADRNLLSNWRANSIYGRLLLIAVQMVSK